MKKINFVFKPESLDIPTETDNIDVMDYTKVHSKNHSPLHFCFSRNDQSEVYTSDSLPEDIFIFEYIQHWWFDETHFYGLESTGFFNLNPCPENVIKRIREKTAYLAISYPMESKFDDSSLHLMNKYIEYIDLPKSQVIYFTCGPTGTDIYSDFCKRYNVDSRFSCAYIPLYPCVYQDMTHNVRQKSITRNKIKKFLMFNRRWANHHNRTLLLYHLFKHGVINNSYVSFSKTEIDNNKSYRHWLTQHLEYFPDIDIDNRIVDTIEDSLPLILDHQALEDDLTFARFDRTDYLYNTSFINIVAETNFISRVVHITEKTFKPMLYKQPFIIASSPYFLKHLRNMGFKTFESCWNEDYDLEEDHARRLQMIVDLIVEINNFDRDKQMEVLNKCQPILMHNFNHLKDFHNSTTMLSLISKYTKP